MPSFDLVSKTDMMEMKNALQMAQKEISSRYDFKGSQAEILLADESTIEIKAEDEMKMKAALDVFRNQMVKRKIGQRCIDPQKIEPHGNRMYRQKIQLKNGIEKDMAKTMVKIIKDSGIKVQVSILDDKLRLQGKKIDELQEAYHLLKTHKDVTVELQMENMKRD